MKKVIIEQPLKDVIALGECVDSKHYMFVVDSRLYTIGRYELDCYTFICLNIPNLYYSNGSFDNITEAITFAISEGFKVYEFDNITEAINWFNMEGYKKIC